jgi:fermentation-respiration switch protein FrsA (DUF1100 family)
VGVRGRCLTVIAWLAILIAALALLGPPALRGYEALLMLADTVERGLPAALDFRPDAARHAVRYEIHGRRYAADLYRPAAAVRAGIVFIPGAAEGGKDDPRVVAFAHVLARARFAVLVPDVVALRELKLLPESAADVADALHYMLAEPGLAPEGRLGLLTTSVGIGPALLAALRPELAGRVRFFVAIGGYHDLPRTLQYLTTGHYEAHGVAVHYPPRHYGKWVYALSNAARLEDAREREAFVELARRKLRDPQADVSDTLARLGPAGRAVYAFITNTDPARSAGLIERLPQRLRADLDALNLAAHDLSRLEARFIIVHGLDDDLIPYGESLALARALPEGYSRVFLLKGFHHVDVAPHLVDGWRMWRAMYALLTERHR